MSEQDPQLSGPPAILLRLFRELMPEWRSYGMDCGRARTGRCRSGDGVGQRADPEDPEAELADAVRWLRTQLSSPVVRYVWRRDGEIAAGCWRLEPTGDELMVSGSRELRQDLATADERIQVRP